MVIKRRAGWSTARCWEIRDIGDDYPSGYYGNRTDVMRDELNVDFSTLKTDELIHEHVVLLAKLAESTDRLFSGTSPTENVTSHIRRF